MERNAKVALVARLSSATQQHSINTMQSSFHIFFTPLFFPQIAIAIGVLTSNRGGGRRTTLADWTWHQGASAGCSGRGAIAGCIRSVPLLGAIVGCHCSVLWRGEGDGQLWGSGPGAIAGCQCNVLWLGWRVTT